MRRSVASRVTPALLTMMSSRPSSVTQRSTMDVTSDSDVTSHRTASAFDPLATSSAAVFWAASRFTSPMRIAAPSRANVSTIARPIPCAAPVTTAVLPSNKPMNNTFVIVRESSCAVVGLQPDQTAASPRR
jgi:hypothetical protein